MANILLITRGTGGDLVPFLGVGSALKALNHNVTLFTHCSYEDVVKRAGLDFVALDRPEEYQRFIEDGHLLNTPRNIPTFFRRHILPQIPTEYDLIKERCQSKDTVLVARYMSDIAAQGAAEKFGIPFVRMFIVVAQITTMPIFAEFIGATLGTDINQLRANIGLPPVSDWHSWLRYPKRSIAPWPAWFASPDSTWPVGVVPVGFIRHDKTETGDIPDDLEGILTGSEPPILITGGLGMFSGSRFYSASAEACQHLGRRGILVTQYEDLVPEHLPDEVKWFKHLPFASLMPYVGAVIHHGGMGTLTRAIVAGVPQLALAVGADRPDTAARLRYLGIGEFLLPPQWQPEIIAGALQRLTSSPTIQARCKDFSRLLDQSDSAAAACKVIEESIVNEDL